jgi:hypothetical protein
MAGVRKEKIMDKEKEQGTAQGSTTPEGVVEEEEAAGISPQEEEREDISLSETTDRTVPASELRKVYKEMKKWKERYRALKSLEPLLAQKDAQVEELHSLISQTRIDRTLLESAKEHGAIEPEQVAQFLKNSVRLGDDVLAYVVDSEGNKRYSDENRPFTLDDLVKEFLTKHPHHRKASTASGSGSSHAPVSIGATLVQRIKNASSQKELEQIVCPKST